MIIRKSKNEDLYKILDLFTASDHKHTITEQYYLWRNHFAKECEAFSYVIENKDKNIIAHYSIFPQEIKFRNINISAGIGQQAVVHPEHRNLSNILELVNFALKDVSKKVNFVFGFPNDNFYLVKERFLKWDKVGRFQSIEYSIKELEEKVKNQVTSKHLENISIIRMNQQDFENYYVELDNNNDQLDLAYSKSYYLWRFYNKPTSYYPVFCLMDNGKVNGIMVLKVFFNGKEGIGHIIHLRSTKTIYSMSLFKYALDYFKKIYINKLSLWKTNKLFEDIEMILADSEEGFYTNLYCKNISLDNKIYEDIKKIGNWNLEMHYSDAF